MLYSVQEIVWNNYEVTGIEREFLEELLKDNPDIWQIQNELALKGIQVEIELVEPCIEIIETMYERYELYED